MMEHAPLFAPPAAVLDENKRQLDRRLERGGWALLLIMLGGLWLIPNVPGATWLIGAGLILLGLNVARYLNHIPMRAFTVVLGVLAVLLGVAQVWGLDLPVIPILLILIGASLLTSVLGDRLRVR